LLALRVVLLALRVVMLALEVVMLALEIIPSIPLSHHPVLIDTVLFFVELHQIVQGCCHRWMVWSEHLSYHQC
jgi:hypothetical protein